MWHHWVLSVIYLYDNIDLYIVQYTLDFSTIHISARIIFISYLEIKPGINTLLYCSNKIIFYFYGHNYKYIFFTVTEIIFCLVIYLIFIQELI